MSELSFLSLNRDLFTIVLALQATRGRADIDALGAGLAAQAHTVEGVPCLAVALGFAALLVKEREFARVGVNLADGSSFAAAADEAHGDALGLISCQRGNG